MSGVDGSGLFALRDALREAGAATPEQLARRLQRPLPVVQAMLEHWARRGRVQQQATPAPAQAPRREPPASAGCGSGACSSCGSCTAPGPAAGGSRAAAAALFTWREQPCFTLGPGSA